MTSSEIQRLSFDRASVDAWAPSDARNINWPVVYVLDGSATITSPLRRVYVGESLNAAARLRQHLASPDKAGLETIRVVLDEKFNKSVCLDLESFLIRLLSGDGAFEVLNRNVGITDAEYYDRSTYESTFLDVFDRLAIDGVFTRTIPQIENSDLFKLSPFKALTHDQAAAVEDILEGLFADFESGEPSTSVIDGRPGTGKTVVAIFLLKLLADIRASTGAPEETDADSMFAEYFVEGYPALLQKRRIGFVVPQQSLRKSVQKVFRRTPGLSADMVVTPFQVGADPVPYDLLIVDEAHRLSQRANQPSGPQNKKFAEITTALYGVDDVSKTQLDWIAARSKHQILLVDPAQTVRPADLPEETIRAVEDAARARGRLYPLQSQMRVRAGDDYVGYVRRVLGAEPGPAPAARAFDDYELRLFSDIEEMRKAIQVMDGRHGLSRLVAGYAWKWNSKADPDAFDIRIGSSAFRWNSVQTDWIASPSSMDEVGSIHTVQGYDLNYAGVIIGPDLRYDAVAGELRIDRAQYFDAKGKENNPKLGIVYSDADLLRYIANIYAVLMTRGIRGTYVYVCDAALREYLGRFIPAS